MSVFQQVLSKIGDGIWLSSLWKSTFTADSDWHLDNVSRCHSFDLVVKTSVTENSPSWDFTHLHDSIKASSYKWHAGGILVPFCSMLSNLNQSFNSHSTWFSVVRNHGSGKVKQVDKEQITTMEKIKLMFWAIALYCIQILIVLRQPTPYLPS